MSILYNVRLLCREAGNQPEINRFVNENMIGLSILSIIIEIEECIIHEYYLQNLNLVMLIVNYIK